MTYQFLLTIDVEDWFQVENFKQWIPFSSWSSCESRVEKNTHWLLDLFDSIGLRQKTEDRRPQRNRFHIPRGRQKTEKRIKKRDNTNLSHLPSRSFKSYQGEIHTSDSKAHFIGTNNGQDEKVRATFFVLGWIAQRLPHLAREIHDRGHEVASHGSSHSLCSECSPEELRKDLNDSKKLLEDITGAPVYGYRAPSFSIDDDSLKIIEDCGYLYDSSFNSFGLNERYGRVALSKNDKTGIAYQVSDTFYELPISNMNLGKRIFPWGGGGYFRMMPFNLFRWGVQSILKKEKNYLFYMHPWEIDPDQPRVNEASSICKFRHYVNLDKTQYRLSILLDTFKHCRFPTCHQYLQQMKRSS